jgi:arsenate reductase
MAEAWTRKLYPERFEPHSAGTNPGRLDPRAVHIMAEVGVDMSTHRSKHVGEMAGIAFDYLITVCDSANEHCPVFPGQTRHIHAGFDDPPRLAAGAINEETALAHYRRVRDEIRDYVAKLPELIAVPVKTP